MIVSRKLDGIRYCRPLCRSHNVRQNQCPWRMFHRTRSIRIWIPKWKKKIEDNSWLKRVSQTLPMESINFGHKMQERKLELYQHVFNYISRIIKPPLDYTHRHIKHKMADLNQNFYFEPSSLGRGADRPNVSVLSVSALSNLEIAK